MRKKYIAWVREVIDWGRRIQFVWVLVSLGLGNVMKYLIGLSSVVTQNRPMMVT
jgi:hypothetical protein